ncbi:MAG: phosphoglucosamine mutase, partial [Primorskyibacter sp.]
ELGAEVIPIGVSPNGYNINLGVGSTHPEEAALAVIEHKADLAICLDGDADRIVVIDETGQVADGDQLMARLAADWADEGRLNKNTLVATVMSNLGLERFLGGRGVRLERTPVGDRYVVETMRRNGYNLGGEQSGHIVMTDYATTGDGLVAGLRVLSKMKSSGQPASALLRSFDPVPQILENVRYDPMTHPLELPNVQAAIADGEAQLGAGGRLLIRKSGTEPLIRVMGESEDEGLLRSVIAEISAQIPKAES